jgi:predicted transcriptional regulator
MVMIDVDVAEEHIAWLVADQSLEPCDDGTYRMTSKGADWLSVWLNERLNRPGDANTAADSI